MGENNTNRIAGPATATAALARRPPHSRAWGYNVNDDYIANAQLRLRENWEFSLILIA